MVRHLLVLLLLGLLFLLCISIRRLLLCLLSSLFGLGFRLSRRFRLALCWLVGRFRRRGLRIYLLGLLERLLELAGVWR